MNPREELDSCRPEQLTARAAAGSPGDGTLLIGLNHGEKPCRLRSDIVVTLVDGSGAPIPTDNQTTNIEYDIVIEGEDGVWHGGAVIFEWRNWCVDKPSQPITLTARDPSWSEELTAAVVADGFYDAIKAPDCEYSGAQSTFRLTSGLQGAPYTAGVLPCAAEQVSIRADWFHYEPPDKGEPDYTVKAGVWLQRREAPPCTVNEYLKFSMLDASGTEIDVEIDSATPSDLGSSGEFPDRVLIASRQLYLRFLWTNYCGDPISGPVDFVMDLAAPRGEIRWTDEGSIEPSGFVLTPSCVDPSQPSTFEIY